MKKDNRGLCFSRWRYVGATILLVLAAVSISTASKTSASSSRDPLMRLLEGNARFVRGLRTPVNYPKERRKLVDGQQPFAIVLSCSDSRVPPELVFDQSLGEIFVVRAAGNVVDPVTLGTIEYAAEHLHPKLLLVLGHESCGAVKAAVDGGHFSPGIESIVERIVPAVAAARKAHPDAKDIVPFAVSENVWVQTKSMLDQSSIIREAVEKSELRMAAGVYHLGSGKVELLAETAAPAHR